MRTVLLLIAFSCFTFFAAEPAAPAREIQQKKKKPKSKYAPPEANMPKADVLKQIESKTAQLAAKIAELKKDKKNHALLPDVEIYLRGAQNIVRFKEWYNKASGQWTVAALEEGLKRADQLAKGEKPWTTLEKRNVLRAYRSVIDGTAQPYGVTYPLDYGKDPKRKWRVDIVLHGRNSSLTEVAFLNSHNGKKNPPADQDWVQIDIFGRGNNAYRWSGETDVMEAMEAFFAGEKKADRDLPDRRRVVLRGFSMGGAGTWHLGLRFPDKWCVMGPGAGFTTTHNYAWKGTKELPDYQEKCLRIYDAIDYVENARMIPIVAFSGGDDPQKLAADNIERRLKELNINTMTHLIKPGVGHKFEPDSFARCNALWSKFAAKGREVAKKVSFVTYTTKADACEWIMVNGLEKHYEKATVDGEATEHGCRLTTKNVRELLVMDPRPGASFVNPKPREPMVAQIDGQEIKAEPRFMIMTGMLLEKQNGKWKGKERSAHFDDRILSKRQRLQGPIDDAFTQGFVCVTGTGKAWHPATQKFVDAKIKAFKYDWAKHWRGELPITNEYGITPNEIRDKNLILFGDPSSNFLLSNMLPKLPLKWTKDVIEFGGKKYSAAEHVPVLIFPNPLNPRRYVVLNTGHTIPSEDYVKTNALLYPRLGDYAILRMTGGANYEVATAGLFDEFWKVK